MEKYLVGMTYHEPEGLELSQSGIDDYESSTAIFIEAESEAIALKWGETVAAALFKATNPTESKPWKSFGYDCWIEKDILISGWEPCRSFFQTVSVGQMPVLERMGTKAYLKWLSENGS